MKGGDIGPTGRKYKRMRDGGILLLILTTKRKENNQNAIANKNR